MSQVSKGGQVVVSALKACIEAAPESTRHALAAALEDYAQLRPMAFASFVNKGGLLGDLFDSIIDASGADT